MNSARRISPPMRNVWLGDGRDRGESKSECCAKCRRGVKGFGELPCGYDLKCPNKCHEKGEGHE